MIIYIYIYIYNKFSTKKIPMKKSIVKNEKKKMLSFPILFSVWSHQYRRLIQDFHFIFGLY
jgi:hypothetical protein